MLFSERLGYAPVKEALQREGIDDATRTGLWNVLWAHALYDGLDTRTDSEQHLANAHLAYVLWHSYFREPIDEVPEWWKDVVAIIRSYVFDCRWYEVFDIIEFIATYHSGPDVSETLRSSFNAVLQREVCAYRFVGGKVVEITSNEEIREIEDALTATESTMSGIYAHLSTALNMLSHREHPDYRNSIKESISAVEGAARSIAGANHASLGDALQKLELDLHPALEGAFKKMYGYTSDADGIRHALMEKPNLQFEDAKYMLVACSAFVNYMIAKATRSGSFPRGELG